MDEYGVVNTRDLVMDTKVTRTGKVGHIIARRQIGEIGEMCEVAFLDQYRTESYWASELEPVENPLPPFNAILPVG
jgi:hypothetical protein